MNETKLYGTSRISYQKIGEARIMIKHTESVNQESATGRTQKIGKIYIESSDGERFRYPFKHLSGARAMARHVSEGGNAYDDFGKHIVGLSEEMSKLRKFKNYMGRSAVMAESLAGYVDVVKERIATVKKTIESLQKPAYYAETVAAFETPMLEDVPADVKENWIDQLTIKQFNEELADVFPYIYKLVSEATRAAELGPDDLNELAGRMIGAQKKYTKAGMADLAQAGREGASEEEKGAIKDKYIKKKTKEEIALEQGFEEMMGQFAETNDETEVQEAYINTSKDAVEVLGALRGKGKAIERGQDDDQGNLANQYVSDVWDVYSFIEARTNGFSGLDKNAKAAIDAMMKLRGEAKKLETKPGSGKNARFGNQIVTVLYPVMEYLYTTDFDRNKKEDDTDEGNAYAHAVKKAKMNGKKKGDKIDGPDGDEITLEKDEKTPLGEFILSYYDRETGEFPKGETAILTMVEKDYGEQFIEPAKAFIEKVNTLYDDHQMEAHPQQMEGSQFDKFKNNIVLYDPDTMEVKKMYPMMHIKQASADAEKLGLIATDGTQYMQLKKDKKDMGTTDLDNPGPKYDKAPEAPKKSGTLDRIKSLAGLR
jgi:hypothetical protein